MSHVALKDLQYPVFEANQVLSSNHLNQLWSYLEKGDLATRAHAIGTGWLGGAEAHITKSGDHPQVIRISCGAGITSTGYLAVIDDCDLRYATVYEDPYTSPPADEGEPVIKGYDAFWFAGTGGKREQHTILELKSEAEVSTLSPAEKTAARVRFRAISLQQHVIVAYVEADQQDIKSCVLEDCNDRGQRMRVNVRKLAMRKQDIVPAGFKSRMTPTGLAPLRMKRVLNYTGANLEARYTQAFTHIVPLLANALRKARVDFSDHFRRGTPNWSVAQITNLLNAKRAQTKPDQIQIYYDFLRDLVSAYNTLIYGGMGLTSAPCVDHDAFPRHLLLSEMRKTDPLAPFIAARHYFQGPPAPNGEEGAVWQLRQNYAKILEMISRFRPGSLPNTGVRILPQDNIPLSENAIPYYYAAAGVSGRKLRKLWNASATRYDTAASSVFHYSDVGGASSNNRFNFNIDDQRMVRIEGHLGRDADVAYSEIEKLKRQFGLAFNVARVFTDTNFAAGMEASFDPAAFERDYEDFRTDLLFQIQAAKILLGKTLNGYEDWLLYLAGQPPSARSLIARLSALAKSLDGQLDQFKANDFESQYIDLMRECAEYHRDLTIFIQDVLDEPLISVGLKRRTNKEGTPYHVLVTLALCELKKQLAALFTGLNPNKLLARAAQYQASKAAHADVDQRRFENFYAKHFGIEHIAGVTFGGTFVMLITAGQVVGDFYLPYLCCCPCDEHVAKSNSEEIYPIYHECMWQKEVFLTDLGMFGNKVRDLSVNGQMLSIQGLPIRIDNQGSSVFVRKQGGSFHLMLSVAPKAIGEMVDFQVESRGSRSARFLFWVLAKEPVLMAHDDHAVTVINKQIVIPVIGNDLLPSAEYTITMPVPPHLGAADIVSKDPKTGLPAIAYNPTTNIQGIDTLEYRITSQLPNGRPLVSQAQVTIHIVECCEDRDDEIIVIDPDVSLPDRVFCKDMDDAFYLFRIVGNVTGLRGPGMGYIFGPNRELITSLTTEDLSDDEVREKGLTRVFVPGASDVTAGKMVFSYTAIDVVGNPNERKLEVTVFDFPDKITTKIVRPTDAVADVTFTYSFQPARGAVEYLWDFGDGSQLSNKAKPKHRYKSGQSYEVILKIRPEGSKSCLHVIRHKLNLITERTDDVREILRPIRVDTPIVLRGDAFEVLRRASERGEISTVISGRDTERLSSWGEFKKTLKLLMAGDEGRESYLGGKFDELVLENASKSFKATGNAIRETRVENREAAIQPFGPVLEQTAIFVAMFYASKGELTNEARLSLSEATASLKFGNKAGIKYSDGFVAQLNKAIENTEDAEMRKALEGMKKVVVS